MMNSRVLNDKEQERKRGIKMNVKQALEVLEEIFEADEGTIKADMVLEDIEEWDSMSKLYLMTYVKKNLKKRLTVEEIREFVTVQDICDYLLGGE